MSLSSNVYIHTKHVVKGAYWINRNDDSWAGSKITLGKADADKLTIFLGIFVIFVEAGVWGLVALALFRRGRRITARDALQHQLQAVFRNVGGSIATLVLLFKFWKVWGWRAWRRRTTALALAAAAASFAAFVVGMPLILTFSLLESQGNEVLVCNPDGCGFWFATFTTSGTTAATLLVNQSQEAVSYVDLCYNRDTPSGACEHLAARRLAAMEVTAATCPFSPDACLYKNKYPAYKWQTVPLDSHVDFGINAKPKDRILLQRTTVCAPLDVDRFTRVIPGTTRDENLTAVYFGPGRGQNYTYMVSNYESVAKSAYHIDVVWSAAANGSAWTSTFTPIPEFSRTDADVSIVFLNNQMIPIKGTDGPCTDPFFSATNRTLEKHKDYYWPDRPITAIGCTDQYAFGNPVTGQWTEPMTAIDTSDWGNFTKDWHLSVGQTAAVASLAWSIFTSGGIDRVILGLEIDALLAKKSPGIFTGFQNPIPNDQWKKEVGYWFNIGLAKLQFGLINIAVGPQDPTLPDLQNMLPSLTVGQKDLARRICTGQKVHSPDHKNYNFAGLMILLILGGLIIVLLPLLKPYILRGLSRKEDLALLWNSYSTLQLQRMAMESADVDKWERLETDIPRLAPRDAPAGYLDIEHRDQGGRQHPKWCGDSTAPSTPVKTPSNVTPPPPVPPTVPGQGGIQMQDLRPGPARVQGPDQQTASGNGH